ncbi:MAG: nitrilase-related carbon-nitrogen hydrolase [Bryobacteraceae bacterium]|jgi:apolipoprotein N-acyltransferase
MGTLIAVALSACAYYLSIGLGEFWPAAWVAPIPILFVAFHAPWRTAAVAAFAAYFLGSLNLFTYLAMVIPIPLAIAALAVPALIYAGAALVARYAVRRLPPWAATFAFPAAWTSYEFLFSRVSPHGTAMSLAYSQTDVLPLLQIVSITGLWGLTFIVTLVPSAIAVAWSRRSVAALGPALVVICVVLGCGIVRLQTAPQQPDVRVGLAATDRGVEAAFETSNPAEALSVAYAYASRISRLAAEGAQVVALPEKLVGVMPADADAIQQIFSDAAGAANVTVIAGFNRFTPAPPRNVAAVFAPGGRLILEYLKHHMLPGPETGYQIGAAPGLFQGPSQPGVPWGVAICKDMDFPAWSRAYGQRGVRLMAVPAWDFVRDARLHSRMAVVRGVEDGFTMARAAQQGFLTFSDAYGRIRAETPSSHVPEALLVANVPLGPGATLYTRFGDWFGWLCVLALAGLAGSGLRRVAASY